MHRIRTKSGTRNKRHRRRSLGVGGAPGGDKDKDEVCAQAWVAKVADGSKLSITKAISVHRAVAKPFGAERTRQSALDRIEELELATRKR